MNVAYLLAAVDSDDQYARPQAIRLVSGNTSPVEAVNPAERDNRWAMRIQAGDRGAFAELYGEYLHAMLGFAYRMVRTAEVAEDICADIFVTLWTKRGEWHPQHGVRAYLFHAVRTRALNALRNSATHARAEANALRAEAVHAAAEKGVEDALDAERTLSIVRTVIAQMPEARRRVMELRWQHGLSIEEVAAVMQLSRSAVDQHLSRGLRVLRQTVPDILGDSAP